MIFFDFGFPILRALPPTPNWSWLRRSLPASLPCISVTPRLTLTETHTQVHIHRGDWLLSLSKDQGTEKLIDDFCCPRHELSMRTDWVEQWGEEALVQVTRSNAYAGPVADCGPLLLDGSM